jgi:hypothetical protein
MIQNNFNDNYEEIEKFEKMIEKLQMTQPNDFDEKYTYHLRLMQYHMELTYYYDIKEFIIYQIRKALINMMFCLLIGKDFQWENKIVQVVEIGKSYFSKINHNSYLSEVLQSEEFEKHLAFIYSDPVDSQIDRNLEHSFVVFKERAIDFLRNLIDYTEEEMLEKMKKFPNFFDLKLE